MRVYAFLGKGGVGKTTLAVSLAKAIKESGKSVCCVSVDQQHNHLDVIRERGLDIPAIRITTRVTKWVEMILSTLGLKEYSKITPIIAHDMITIVSLSELAYSVRDKYDCMVIDMPPNHSAIDMLYVPNVLENNLVKLLTLKHRIKRRFGGKTPELDNLEYMVDVTQWMKETFENRSCFMPLAIPTRLGVLECTKVIETLKDYGMKIKGVVMNMVSKGTDCDICRSRMTHEAKYINELLMDCLLLDLKVHLIPFSFNADEIDAKTARMV